MLTNKDIAISTSKILLVPYEPHHVRTYHKWMEDEEIRAATASEALSLDEEYAMQRTWRNDADKLTFIACLPLPPSISITSPSPMSSPTRTSVSSSVHEPLHPSPPNVLSGTYDKPNRIIGDVNLYLTLAASEEDAKDGGDGGEEGYVGELELMIAPLSARRQGYGRATLLAFLMYIRNHLKEILNEYQSRIGSKKLPKKTDEKDINDDVDGDNSKIKMHMTKSSNDDTDSSKTNDPKIPAKSNGQSSQKTNHLYLKVKIGASNKGSIRLFRSAGFLPVRDGAANYFGEVEMVLDDFRDLDSGGAVEGLMQRWGSGTYEELEYWRD